MKNFHLIVVKYHGATNTRGSRVSLYSERFGKRVTIQFDYAMNHISEMAENYLIEKGFYVVGCGESKNGYIIITDTFKSL